jgi:hypothetical protein
MYMIRNKTKGPHFQLLKYTIIRYNRIRKFSVSNIKEKQAGALLLKNHKLYLPKPTASEPFMILSLLHLRMNILQYNKISKIKQFYFFRTTQQDFRYQAALFWRATQFSIKIFKTLILNLVAF